MIVFKKNFFYSPKKLLSFVRTLIFAMNILDKYLFRVKLQLFPTVVSWARKKLPRIYFQCWDDEWTERMSKKNSIGYFFGLKFFVKKIKRIKKIVSAENPKTIRFQQIWSENWKESNNARNTFLIFASIYFYVKNTNTRKNWRNKKKEMCERISVVGVRIYASLDAATL